MINYTIAEVKKNLTYLLDYPIKSLADLKTVAKRNSKLAEVMEAWSFLNYTETYSWNTLLVKLVPDYLLLNQAFDLIKDDYSKIQLGHTYIELYEGYSVIGVIKLTLDNQLTIEATEQYVKEDLEVILDIEAEGVNENLGSQCGGVTEVTKNSSVEVSYLVVVTEHPQVVIKDDYTFLDLQEVTEEELINSLYTDKLTAELMFPGSFYRVLEVNPVNIKQQLMQHYNLTESEDYATPEHSLMLSTVRYVIVHSQADELFTYDLNWNPKRLVDCSDYELLSGSFDFEVGAIAQNEIYSLNGKVIKIEFDYHNKSEFRQLLKDYFASRVLVSQLNCYLPKEEAISFNQGTGNFEVEQPLFTKEEIEHIDFSNVLTFQLTPKLQLFTSLTEWTYLMECYLYLLGLNENVSEVRSLVHSAWFTIIYFMTSSYINQPLPSINDYIKLLRLNHENRLQLA
jgi:hypothetical protein